MEIFELLDNMHNVKDKNDIINELIKINEFKIDFLENKLNEFDCDTFIHNVINKYRDKLEVCDFYNSSDGDHLGINYYDTLCLIEKMIYNYIIRKIVNDKCKNV